MSSIMKELLFVSSITKRRHMEVAPEISISCNPKASSMVSQECVGGPKNGSSKSACRASRLYTEQVFTGVNSKSACRAARLQSSCTRVHSRTRQRSAMVLPMNYANHRSDGDSLLIVSNIILNTTWKSQLLIDEQYNERTARRNQYY
jgi:hypothetical protein